METENTNNIEENGQGEVTAQEGAKPEGEVTENTGEGALGDAGKKALAAERQARKDAEKQLSELSKRIEEFEDSKRTDEEKRQRALEREQKRAGDLVSENEDLKRQILVRDVVDEVGLPKELMGRLRGDDYESLVEDAKELKELFGAKEDDKGPRKPSPVPQAAGGTGAKVSNGELFAQAISSAFNR